MFDRPTDSWYIYMRPFSVALLLQLRNLQRSSNLQNEQNKEIQNKNIQNKE